MRFGFIVCALMAMFWGCHADHQTDEASTTEAPAAPVFACTPSQPSPYDETTPYLGIHGDAGNSDVVSCETAPAFEQTWHVLRGHAIPQPNTFSPDGLVTYVTSFPSTTSACTVHALSVTTGETQWCKELPPSVAGSSVNVDADGMLYVAAGSAIYAYTADGVERWRRVLGDVEPDALEHRTFGLHFSRSGHIVTVTVKGIVYLISRDSGEVAAELDLPTEYGFVSPKPSASLALDIVSLFPEASIMDLETAFSGRDAANVTLGNFLGVSGEFTDNTVGVSKRDEIYIQAGGPTEAIGSIIQVKIESTEADVALKKGWYILAEGGSAASPSISKNGTYLVFSDGAASGSALSPAQSPAYVALVDLEACNANEDSESDPGVCGVIKRVELERGSMSGAPPIADDGTVYYWESGLDFANYYDNGDVFKFGPNEEKTSIQLPNGRDWTSVMTVSDNHLIGTTSKYTESETRLVTRTLPSTIEHHLVLLDRETMKLLWEAPVTDDSTSTITIDKRGGLYVNLFGLLNIIATDERPTLGLIKFSPVEAMPLN